MTTTLAFVIVVIVDKPDGGQEECDVNYKNHFMQL